MKCDPPSCSIGLPETLVVSISEALPTELCVTPPEDMTVHLNDELATWDAARGLWVTPSGLEYRLEPPL